MKTLFIVGAQRSGTSYLYKILDSHPSVELAKPIRPEPKFFLKKKLCILGKEYYLSRYFDTKNNKNVYTTFTLITKELIIKINNDPEKNTKYN